MLSKHQNIYQKQNSVKKFTRLDKIKNKGIRNKLGLFSINDKIRENRQDWLKHEESM
jgi:hypothetical protein